MPSVSIILTAYNPGNFLGPTVQSVIAQTYTDWELIAVDDGSPQDVSFLRGMHSAIKSIRQENRGLSIARNVGLLHSTGKYIAFLDQDDLWAPTKLQRQVQVLDENPELGFCYTDFDRIDAEGRRIGPGFEGGAETYLELLKGCCICVSTTLVRRSALAASGMFDPGYVGTQDWDMWLKIARWHKVKFIAEPLAQYRQHSNNMSHRYPMLFGEVTHLLRWHMKLARMAGDEQALRIARGALRRSARVYGAQAYDHARQAFHDRRYSAMAGHLGRALRLTPAFTLRSVAQSVLPRRRAGEKTPAALPATHTVAS